MHFRGMTAGFLFIPLDFIALHSGPSGVLGIWGELLFVFRELGSIDNYLRGSGEQANTFGDLRSPAKK